jgi:iron complex outermembrane receptor protein
MSGHVQKRRPARSARVAGAAVAVMLAAISTQTIAQDAAPRGDTPPGAAARTPITAIETVTTTARKREEPLQEAPVAVTALTGQDLELTRATDIKSLSFPAPSVNLARLGSFTNAVTVFIRGIGNADNDSTVDPPVAIFVDGVYIPRPEGSSLDLFDVEAVEILRGPQGTLFGRNTTAGAIQIRTRRPSGEFGMRGKVGFGQYGQLDIRASVDVPVVEGKFDAKVAVMSLQQDGWYTNSANGEKLGATDTFSIRPILRFTPTEDLTLTLIGEYVRFKADPTPGITAARPTQLLCAQWKFCGRPRPINGKFTKDDYLLGGTEVPVTIDDEVWGITGELEWDVGPGTVTWVSNYRKTNSFIWLDIDNTPAPMFHTQRTSPHKQASSELRFASTAWDSFDFVAGVYGFYQEFFLHRHTFQRLTPAVPPNPPGILSDNWQDHKSFSVFAEGNYHVTDALTLTVGGRYTWEKKDFWIEPFAPFPNTGTRIDPDPESWSNFGPKAGVSYQINDQVLSYFTYSRGFKSGGWNGRGGTPTTVGPYDPEVVDGFELGLKSDWFDNRLRANIALFYNKYKDLQRTIIRPLPGAINPQETVTQNAADASIKGVELELTAVPVTGLQLKANVSYLDAKYGEFCADLNGSSFFPSAPTSPCGGNVFNVTSPGSTGPGNYLLDDDFSATPLQRAPKWQFTLGANYEFEVGNAGSILLAADYTHVGNLNVTVDGLAQGWRGKVDLVNASITFREAQGRYSISVYGRNLTNDIYLTGFTAVATLLDSYGISDPRRWGVELSWEL